MPGRSFPVTLVELYRLARLDARAGERTEGLHGKPRGRLASRGEQAHLGQVAVGHHARGVAVVTMRGEHDLSTQPVLARALQLAAAHSNVIVDLSECSFIDSTVIKEFIRTSETVRAVGEQILLVIPAEQAQVARIAKIVGLAQVFEVHESKDAAFASLEDARDKKTSS